MITLPPKRSPVMIYAGMLKLDADVLLRETTELTKQERWVTARLLVRLAAVEKRELYAPCGYSSMSEYCRGELGMSEDAAGRRLWAARKCREFPALFDALANDRIHLTAVHTLATHLRCDNVDELITAATGRSKAQLKDWLACRFPQPAVPTLIRPVVAPVAASAAPFAAAPVSAEIATIEQRSAELDSAPSATADLSPSNALQTAPTDCKKILHALARVPVPSNVPNPPASQVPLRDRARVDPLNAEQVKVQFTMSRGALAKMQHAMDLLGEAVARNDVAALFERLLDMALPALEKRKFAATNRPRAPRAKASNNPRTISAHVKREVARRDGGRCAIESATGKRCECTRALEYDHVKPVSLGGTATVENVRLLCRKHNQLEAERRLGAEFVRQRREPRLHRSTSGEHARSIASMNNLFGTS